MAQLVARLVRNEKVGGSNPPSSTTGRHPIRMSVFCMPGRCCGAGLLCCSWRRGCSGRRRARPLYVPVGGGPPARSPHASLRLGVVDLEARPGPASTHRHRGQAIRRPPHRRQLVSRSQARHSRRPWAPQPGPPDPPAPFTPAVPGVLMVLRVGSKTGQAPPPPTGTAVWPCHRPRAPQPGPPDPPAPFTPAALGVRLCRLAPHPPCMRYKVRPARVVGGQSGTKFALHARNSPKRAISSEQGEFYTAHAMRRGVQGDFCTGSGDVWLVQGEFCRALRHCSKALKSSTGTEARPSRVPLPSTSTKPATYADRLLRYG